MSSTYLSTEFSKWKLKADSDQSDLSEEELKYLEQLKLFTEDSAEPEDVYDRADTPFDHEVAPYDCQMWRRLISMHNDLNILDTFFWKSTEKFFIIQITRIIQTTLEHVDELEKIIPYLDTFLKHYVNRFLAFICGGLKTSGKQLDNWVKRLDKYKTNIYLREIGNNIFEFIKLMDDNEVCHNLLKILKEIKEFTTSGDVGVANADRGDLWEAEREDHREAAF